MAECISREATLNLIEHNDKVLHYADERYENVVYATTQAICKVVVEIPAADVQPVVRCKDCKHRKERHYEESGEKPYIKYECKFTKYSMSDDGFCSFGARMDGDTE